ncbi:MAG: polymerase primary sigma factor, partial [Acidimicrobiaceae bacterium]|nr:polymerase primary sigma factor [Acidimicrobiaceae bacterium]
MTETNLPPVEQVVPADWEILLARGHADGTVHADDVARVLKDVELSEDVIIEVRDALLREGIAVDESVDELADELPVEAPEPEAREPDVPNALPDRKRRLARVLAPERGDGGGTSDTVRMYLKEIGRVNLLNAEKERELAMRIEAGLAANERLETEAAGID